MKPLQSLLLFKPQQWKFALFQWHESYLDKIVYGTMCLKESTLMHCFSIHHCYSHQLIFRSTTHLLVIAGRLAHSTPENSFFFHFFHHQNYLSGLLNFLTCCCFLKSASWKWQWQLFDSHPSLGKWLACFKFIYDHVSYTSDWAKSLLLVVVR